MKYLHLKPRLGLANRMRALASGMWMAERLALRLVLSWEDDAGLACPFQALFSNVLDRDARALGGLSTAPLRDPRFVDPDLRDDHDVVEIASCQPFSHDPAVEAYSDEFWTAVRPYLLALTPVEEVQRRVAALAASFEDTTLGVHVRWDGQHFKYTTAEMFFPEIDAILEREPATRIFLASDSPAAIERFRERYRGAVLTLDGPGRPGPRRRDDVAALRDALADLLLLLRTRRLLGTFYSSFTELAGVLGAIPFKTVGSYGTRDVGRQEFGVRVRGPR
jgi:hypothetical protein